MISETKLHGSFPEVQFLIGCYHAALTFYRNKNGGRIMLYAREGIPVKLLSHDIPFVEIFLLRLIFTKRNGLLIALTVQIRVGLLTIWS